MRIGILTFHRAINYGAVLQCYALYKTLKSMGYDVEVIDYRPNAIEKYRMQFRMKDFADAKGVIGKLRYLVSCITLIGSKFRTSKKFDAFLCNNLTMSPVYKDASEIKNYYDVVFFGSDQIWNPQICEGLDKAYYGQFDKGHAKFIGYAVSLGRQDLILGQAAEPFKLYLGSFDKIAVREETLQKFLADKFDVNAEMVCDPSLLLSREECEGIAVKPKDEKYVLLFMLEDNPCFVKFAERIACQIDAKVIRMGAVQNPFHNYHCKMRPELSPAEFMGYIKHADCIVTDSFHATSFSIIMQKNFYTLMKKNNNDRSKTILSVAGLEGRQIDACKDVIFSSVDFTGVQQRLDSYKNKSILYISECLP